MNRNLKSFGSSLLFLLEKTIEWWLTSCSSSFVEQREEVWSYMANSLLKEVAKATGLPTDLITKELGQIVSDKGISNQDDLSLEDLRSAMAQYLREVLLHAKNKFEDGVEIEEEISPEDLGQE